MSFGEGNLHEKVEHLEEVNGALCAEVNRQEKEIEQLRALARDLGRRIPWSNAFYDGAWHHSPEDEALLARMRELGVER